MMAHIAAPAGLSILRSALLAMAILLVAIVGIIWTLVRASTLHMRRERKWQQRMRRQLLEAVESERRLMAAELHDDIVQRLVVLGHSVEALDGSDHGASGVAEELFDVAESVRQVARQMHPQEAGLVRIGSSLRRMAEEMAVLGLSVQLDGPLDADDGLSSAARVAVLRVVQEALRNARQHGLVQEASVKLTIEGSKVTLEVQDLGRGFDPETVRRGLGMSLMRDRMLKVGGLLDIVSAPNRGTTVTARIPRHE